MNKKIYLKAAFWGILFTGIFNSCVKTDDYSTPSIQCNDRFTATNHTLAELAALGKVAPAQTDIIANDFIVEGYVSSSDESGNIYKQLFIQDKPENPTIAIEMDIDTGYLYTSFPVGSKVRINAKGLIVQAQNGNVKLGSYDPSYAIGRINPNFLTSYLARTCGTNGLPITAKMVPVEFATFADACKPENINKLVKVNQVQFAAAELTKNFTDVNPASTASDRYMEDLAGTSFDFRNSIYATFAKTGISPNYTGNGSVTMILSLYTAVSGTKTYQGYIRSLEDLTLKGSRSVTVFSDDFSSNNLNNWLTSNVLGAQVWGIAAFGNPKPSAIMNGFSGGSKANEDWLLTKPLDLSGGSANYYVTFETDGRSLGNPLELYVTDNYTGNPATTTWTKLNPALDTDMNAFAGFVSSGAVDITAFKGKKTVTVAFKYTSTNSAATSWEIDNFKVIGL